jgi:RNA polymerase sigma factor (sigma-70 family)
VVDGASRRHATQFASVSNGDLLARCAAGDQSAWSEIVSRYERLIFAIPVREGLAPDDAADVTQDTFAALLRSISSVEDPERLGSWLMTVARRLTWHRRHIVRANRVIDAEERDETPHEGLVQALWVYEAIRGLGEPCREMITSLFFDPAEPSYAEIALRMQLPIGSLGPMRSRCLERLRKILDAESPT